MLALCGGGNGVAWREIPRYTESQVIASFVVVPVRHSHDLHGPKSRDHLWGSVGKHLRAGRLQLPLDGTVAGRFLPEALLRVPV